MISQESFDPMIHSWDPHKHGDALETGKPFVMEKVELHDARAVENPLNFR